MTELKRSEAKSNSKGKGLKLFSKGETLPTVTFDKYKLDFGLGTQLCPLQTTVRDKVRIACTGGKGRFTWRRPRIFKTHHIVIEPLQGVLKKGAAVDVSFTLLVNTTFTLEDVLILEIEGLGRFFFVLNLASEKSVFGVHPGELPQTADEGLQVPQVLATMRQWLVSHDGLRSEGIFRLAPDEAETLQIKSQLNKGEFQTCSDVNCISNLIKVWFRELPVQLLNALPSSAFAECETEQECLQLYHTLAEPSKTLLLWLVKLMAHTAGNEPVNKMGVRNLAIVIAPNLFTSSEELAPLESLQLSQNVVNFVRLLLEHYLKEQQL